MTHTESGIQNTLNTNYILLLKLLTFSFKFLIARKWFANEEEDKRAIHINIYINSHLILTR